MFEDYPSLLVTKLYIPRLRSSHISRATLLAALDAGLEHKLILIAAAAGFGKTTLLSDWSNQRTEEVAWLSLDEGDNDPARFLSYLVAAIQTRRPQIGHELLAALQSAQPPAIENALHVLINQLATVPDRLILVLDDYHVIENPAIHSALAFLLDHLPPQMTIILLTRTDPALPLARLRAQNDLLELRAATLRFSTEDTERFLNQAMHLDLSQEMLRALDTRTEGWIAGLQLAAIAMQTSDKQGFVQSFTGSHRFVLDYLMEEVLAQQPEGIRRFLLQTSVLSRLNGALCGTVTGEADGQATLEYLERNNLFLIPLDESRYWYRYHHLFADLLQARLQAEYPDVLKELRQRAARWHEENGFPEEAVVYALEADNFDYAAYLMLGPAAGVTRRGEVTTLLDWYRTFPPDFVSSHPRLSLQFGMAFALNGRWNEAETLLSYVEQQDIASRPEESLLLAYLVASYRQDAGRLTAIAQAASARVQPNPVTKMVLALVVSLGGDLHTTCQLLAEAQESAEREGDMSLALTALFHQCRFQVFIGNLHHAYELSQTALSHIHDVGNAALPMATFAHVSLGRTFIEWNDTEKASQHLLRAIQLSETSGFVTGTISSATMMLAEVKQARGDSEGANETAQQAISLAQRYDPPAEVEWLKTYRARLWLAQGNIQAAGLWMKNAQSHNLPVSMFYPTTIQNITSARVLLAQRKPKEAIAILTSAEPHNLLSVEALGALALARQAQGDNVHSMLTLEQALTLAEAENRVRALLDLGYPIAKLLARFCETHPQHDYARTLLAAFPASSESNPPIEPLSERELEVLRLIVAGYSNEEIANALTLAMSTVKWYVNVLYSKLHVKTRSQAIARVHELKLLAD
jgi:LuxR family transcriptional regulator, maltose regulon positive regulatory protein